MNMNMNMNKTYTHNRRTRMLIRAAMMSGIGTVIRIVCDADHDSALKDIYTPAELMTAAGGEL